MNKSVKLNKCNAIHKVEALDNLFRLAECLGYPFEKVVYPKKTDIEKAFAITCGIETFDQVYTFQDHLYVFNGILTDRSFLNNFFDYEFLNDECKQFAHQMLQYIFLDQSKIVLILRALKIEPVNKQITQALIDYDVVNNIKLGFYSHPYFLIEYYKVSLAIPFLDTVDPTMVKIYSENFLRSDFKDYNEYGNHISRFFDPLHPAPEIRFQDFTTNFDAHPMMIRYEIHQDVLNHILKFSGRKNINKMARYLNRTLLSVVVANLKYVKANKSNSYISSCLKYRNNVNNDDQVMSFEHDLFDHYFVSYYGLEFIQAIQDLHNESICEKKQELNLTVDDLTTDIYCRFTMNIGIKDFTKYMFRYMRTENRFNYEQGMAKIHGRIIANNKLKQRSGDFLSAALIQYINALYSDFDVLTNSKAEYMPYLK